MSDFWFSSLSDGTVTAQLFFWCTLTALALGALVALVYRFRNRTTESFLFALALLPVMVEVVIMLVNGQIGTGIAVMGAFSLIRFRSMPGTAREIVAVFCSMVIGLACGGGYLGVAILFTAVVCAVGVLYTLLSFGKPRRAESVLRFTVPEDLDYTNAFDEVFSTYTSFHEPLKVKTTNMGSLFQLTYRVVLRDAKQEKAFLDAIRTRNGNLEVMLNKGEFGKDEL